jgi:protein-S-isoprenylcysteine O-methyltransferase Ste14
MRRTGWIMIVGNNKKEGQMKTYEGSLVSCMDRPGSPQKKMTHWGVGPRLAAWIFPYCAIIVLSIISLGPVFHMGFIPYRMLAYAGTGLILLGIPFYVVSLSSVMRAFKEGKLVTSGVYGMCRHPVYASWIIFFIPGIALLLNNWIVLTIAPVMYWSLRMLVREEDAYLEKTFKTEYLAYKKRVPPVLPIGYLKSIFS